LSHIEFTEEHNRLEYFGNMTYKLYRQKEQPLVSYLFSIQRFSLDYDIFVNVKLASDTKLYRI